MFYEEEGHKPVESTPSAKTTCMHEHTYGLYSFNNALDVHNAVAMHMYRPLSPKLLFSITIDADLIMVIQQIMNNLFCLVRIL